MNYMRVCKDICHCTKTQVPAFTCIYLYTSYFVLHSYGQNNSAVEALECHKYRHILLPANISVCAWALSNSLTGCDVLWKWLHKCTRCSISSKTALEFCDIAEINRVLFRCNSSLYDFFNYIFCLTISQFSPLCST